VNAMFQILGNSKDEVALMLLGSDETENSLNYKNIKLTHSMALPTWEMVQFVSNLKGTTVNGDWLDAVVVAMDVLKKESEYVHFYHHHHHCFCCFCFLSLSCFFVVFCFSF
jgi:hypothetical protein